ncbi:hypothetical protein JCM11641_003018 [Rhodosporidiobolus odoratus]
MSPASSSANDGDLSLAVNCGSSSIKIQLFDSKRRVLLKGSADNVQGDQPASYSFKYSPPSASSSSSSAADSPTLSEAHERKLEDSASYEAIFREILKDLVDEEVLGKDGKDRIRIVAHRIVHGGTADTPVLIRHGKKEEKEVLDKMEEVSAFAPLHNHHAMLIVRECLEHLPSATSILCFDTLFHRTIPHYRRVYAIAEPSHPTPVPLVKYGFHGLSYGNIVRQMAEELGKKVEETNIVVAHLGSGGSCCLIQEGESRQTTMGVTPLEGLPGGTRSGTVDPSLIFHVVEDSGEMVEWSGRQISKGEYILNKDSGFKAMCGTNNFGTITSRAFPSSSSPDDVPQTDERMSARLAYTHYLDRLLSYLTPYISTIFSSSQPLDALVFSGGIGEKSSKLRADVLNHFRWVEELAAGGGKGRGGVDEGRNAKPQAGRARITKEGSKIPAYVVETSEEEEMVRIAWEEMEKEGRA